MTNYLNNNLDFINEYAHLYKDGINIDNLIEKFKTEMLIVHNGFDYARFRVFIDSCLLLLNKEKLNVYYKNKYSFKEFFCEIENDKELESYLKFIQQEKFASHIQGVHLYYSMEGKKKTPWNQMAMIRNAMAHMQYGHFTSKENGLLIYYFLYNKDKGVCKDWGIVFEPILHKFVQKFFSNYSYGILFQNTFFMKYSLKKMRKTRNFIFYEITSKNESMETYNGYNTNFITKLAYISDDYEKIISFLLQNQNKMHIKEMCIKDIIDTRSYKKIAKKFKLNSDEKYFCGLKTFLDFEAELSNFLVHIIQLNETLYQYRIMCDSDVYTKEEIREYKKQFEKKLMELKEDENKNLSFVLGFTYLRVMNFCLRIEDDDYMKLEYADIDVDMFYYDTKAFAKYVADNGIETCQLQRYIIERMRNAFMHGNIGVSLCKAGEILFVFSDIHNKRKEKVEISLSNLKVFLEQKCLYYGVPQETLVSVATIKN